MKFDTNSAIQAHIERNRTVRAALAPAKTFEEMKQALLDYFDAQVAQAEAVLASRKTEPDKYC